MVLKGPRAVEDDGPPPWLPCYAIGMPRSGFLAGSLIRAETDAVAFS